MTLCGSAEVGKIIQSELKLRVLLAVDVKHIFEVEQTVGLHYHLYRCSYLMASRYSFMAVLFVVVTIRFFFSFQQDVYSYPLYVPIGRKSLME